MPLAYGIGGLISVPQGAVSGFGAPPASFIGQLGQQYFDKSTSPPTLYIFNGVTWRNITSTTALGLFATLDVTGEANFGDNLKISESGKGLQIKAGSPTDFAGNATLVNGTITVPNTNILSGDLILLSRSSSNGSASLGALTYFISNAVGFTINSLMPSSPSSIQTVDHSSVAYFIIRPLV
jgi:hypothetical protein